MTQQRNVGSTWVSLQDSMNADMWPSETLPDLNSTQYYVYIQNYFMPDNLSRPDDLSALSGQYGIDIDALEGMSQPPQSFAYHNNGILRHEGRSILSRSGSLPNIQIDDQPITTMSTSSAASYYLISEERRQSMQRAVSNVSDFTLPPRRSLSRYIRSYFKSFHRYQPFLQLGHLVATGSSRSSCSRSMCQWCFVQS